MESKFSTTYQDKVINEQEEISKQIIAHKMANQKDPEETGSDDRGTVTTQPKKNIGNDFKNYNHVSAATIQVNQHAQGTVTTI